MRANVLLMLYLLPFCLVNLSITINVATDQCLSHQQSLLLQLKNNLIFNPTKSTKLIHWSQNGDCCKWTGVACSKGRVISLDVSQESISGGTGDLSSLFNLQYLQSLNLAYNEFHYEIPYEFQMLKNLRYLNLSNAGFVGQVPIEISYLKKLETLDLSTAFTSQHSLRLDEPNIAMFAQNFAQIKELYLDGIAISSKGKGWAHALSSLHRLQVLSMSSCNLSGPLDSSLSKLQALSVLRLNQNNIASMVPDCFDKLSNLTTLQLSGCGLSGVFPQNIFQIPSLQVLDVSDNQCLHGSMPNFPHHGSLHKLNLSHTNFSGPLPESIHNLRQLSTLDLSNCQFNGTLPSSMSDLTELVHLDLSFNNFTGPLPSFNRSTALRILSLNNNELRGMVPSTHFDGLTNLVSIDLGDNSLDGRVPSSLFTLPSLQQLFLSYNEFGGVLDEFPNASSSSLEMLDLSGNSFQGPIPRSIFQLKRLILLQLSSNKFNGKIQLDIIGKLRNLATFDLSHNNLSVDASITSGHDVSFFPNLDNLLLASCKLTSFPTFLRNHSNLLFLDLSSNQIEGTIPNWIWRFEFLNYLNLSSNLLTGFEGHLQNLSSNLFLLDLHDNLLDGQAPIFTENVVYLDYSGNKFSSISPADISNLNSAAILISLSNNNFHGEIPESFCNISTLRVLDLSYNRFSGKIPECLTARHISLRVLSLAGNKLNSHIPDTFSASCALRFLDLNENLLGGTLPKSLANCKNLQVLNVGSNQLVDNFPCFLNNISALRVMILRANEFHGHIECPDITGGWGMLQIVDLASNNFSGMLPKALFGSWKALILGEHTSQFAHLSSDIYDGINPVDFVTATAIFNNAIKMKLAELAAVEPFYVVDHLLSHVYKEALGLHRFEDSITIVDKGQREKLDKILVAFTLLDFSCNRFEGPIPQELMDFKALHALNLSQNALSGRIPSTLGNLRNLESLDLSLNSLEGEIPPELATLTFLSTANLSCNHLAGRIPTGTQIQTFGADSFIGNEGLCGPPLARTCGGEGGPPPPPGSGTAHSRPWSSVDWSLLSQELGFTFGFGIFVMPLLFWKRWRLWYSKKADELLYRIVPQLGFVYQHHQGQTYRSLRWRPY